MFTLSSKQIYDYFENVVIMVPGQVFKPLGPFQSPHCEELNFVTLFIGQPHSNQRIKMFHQMIVQWELLHKFFNLPHIYQICFLKLLKY
jgi:hypothetical protein